jgi:hypothetical protein
VHRLAQRLGAGLVGAHPVGGAVDGHGRNAKLQLSVLLAPEEPVEGLYLHPQHRRRPRRVDHFGDMSV